MGVTVGPSPQWLQDRLEAIGQRSINNIVDATNYVMFAIGQPIHAYDAELFPQVDGSWRFDVRRAVAGETVSLIPEGGKDEDRVVECQGAELLIVDGSSNTPIGLAGVKGGRFAGVHADTRTIIVETAHFHPTLTRKTARRLGIVIDASKRFENEPSRELIPYTQAEVTKLICDIAGGTLEGMVDVYLEEATPTTVSIDPMRVNRHLGLSLSTEDMQHILEMTGAVVTSDGTTLTATNPWERTDLTIEEDYIEEIGRLHGYCHIKAVAPAASPLHEFNTRHFYAERIRDALISEGFSEVITSSFRNKDEVQLRNALASDKSYLRSTLRTNISDALDKNAGFTDLLGTSDTRVFEIGTVFHKSERGIDEHVALALGVRLKPSGYTGKEDKLLTTVTTTIETLLNTPIEWTIEKGVAECNLTQLLAQLPQPTAYEPVTVGAEVSYQPFSSYQHMSRDIAMWVSEGTAAADVTAVLNEHAGPLRVRTTQFDEFTKDGRTSLGFRLVFQSKEKTLTDEEVNVVMDVVYAAVAERGWEVR
jgi:phenylalanyl-tRNA synthetase beta chain